MRVVQAILDIQSHLKDIAYELRMIRLILEKEYGRVIIIPEGRNDE